MKNITKYLLLSAISLMIASCSKENEAPVANNVKLEFKNTFGDTEIVLGGSTSSTATVNTSKAGQVHHFEELKYVISNIRLVKADGTEVPYNVNDLNKGATVINQANPSTLNYVLSNIPSAEYKQIKFGLGIRADLNILDPIRFPVFFNAAGANDTKMHWEWSTGYRFTKIEGFYDTDNKPMSIHTGSTVKGTNGDPSTYVQGVDAYRDIVLDLPKNAVVGMKAPKIVIKADFNKLLSGQSNTITLGEENTNIHDADSMLIFVDNLGGNGTTDLKGMFSIISVEN